MIDFKIGVPREETEGREEPSKPPKPTKETEPRVLMVSMVLRECSRPRAAAPIFSMHGRCASFELMNAMLPPGSGPVKLRPCLRSLIPSCATCATFPRRSW